MQRGVDPDTIEVPGTGLERSRVVGVYQTLENLKISKSRNASFDTHPKTWSRRPVRGRFLSYETLIMN
jgi:hypothetical protein